VTGQDTRQTLLAVDRLTVDYGGRRARSSLRALEGVSLHVAQGETVGLVGESGSGKSTIARAVLGLVPVTSGTITFAGRDITSISFRERRSLAADLQAVFQDPTSSLNPSRTVGAILAEPMIARGIRDRARIRERTRVMLEKTGLPPDAAARYPAQFSGGQRQRIGIARALMLAPKLVICDEVVSALDLSVQAQILNLLHDLQQDQGLSYLFISHDPDVVRHLCDRVVVLYRGRGMEAGPGERVMTVPAHHYTDELLAAAPLPDPRLQRARQLLAGSAAAAAAAAAAEARGGGQPGGSGCPFSDRCRYAADLCRREAPALRPVPVATGPGRPGAGAPGAGPAEAGPAEAARHGEVSVACHRYPQWRAEKERQAAQPETPAASTQPGPATVPAHNAD
jgi:peptide/nickel transport system ATP-binding protein